MDAVITSENSPVYYNLVSRTMGLNSSALDDFYRFFRISGMGHCSGGDGAHMIGNQLMSVSSLDTQNNVLLRMVDWVENGNAPETVTGTRFVDVSFFLLFFSFFWGVEGWGSGYVADYFDVE